jgi:hypothetical protein
MKFKNKNAMCNQVHISLLTLLGSEFCRVSVHDFPIYNTETRAMPMTFLILDSGNVRLTVRET